ncbi:hypothetical protein [Nostoc sp.]
MTKLTRADKLKPVDVYSQNNTTTAIALRKVGDRIFHWSLGIGYWGEW